MKIQPLQPKSSQELLNTLTEIPKRCEGNQIRLTTSTRNHKKQKLLLGRETQDVMQLLGLSLICFSFQHEICQLWMCPKAGRTKGLEIKRTRPVRNSEKARRGQVGRRAGREREGGRQGGRSGADRMNRPWENRPAMPSPGFIPGTAGIHRTPQQEVCCWGSRCSIKPAPCSS